LLLGLLALGLMIADQRFQLLGPGRDLLGVLATPVYWVADLPARIGHWGDDNLVSRGTLAEQNATLRAENLVLKARLQKLASVTAENVRLRELLNSTALLDETILVAEVIGVNPDPNLQVVVIDRGSDDGVYEGQAVIDAHGLVGQVIEVNPVSSRVLLVTDASHAVPVRVNRNGVRAIAEGSGSLRELDLRHVASTVDLREGDLLVSSGLGRIFPEGYPVATVTSVVNDPGKPFADVKAVPNAQLQRSRHVMLVFSGATPELTLAP
jgi:rod shape-determining protein MreC